MVIQLQNQIFHQFLTIILEFQNSESLFLSYLPVNPTIFTFLWQKFKPFLFSFYILKDCVHNFLYSTGVR